MKIAFVLALSLASTACHTTPIADVIDCAKLEQGKLTGEFAKLVALVPNWALIGTTCVADAAQMSWEIVGCALADLTQQYLTTKGATSTVDDTNNASSTLESFRSSQGHNASFLVKGQKL